MNRPLFPRRAAIALLATSACVVSAGLVAGLASPQSSETAIDPALPQYERVGAPKGTLRLVGSSTVCGLLARMSDAFRAMNPDVKFDVKGGGSATAPAALLDGSADLAPMSRPLTADERAQFQAKFGYAPTEIVVGIDALAVFVHKDNPVTRLTVDDIAGLFGDGAKGRATAKAWGELGTDLGLVGAWQSRPVVAYGFRADSGSSSIMRDAALGGGAFRADIRVQPGASAIVNGVGADPGGVGYASQFYRSKATRMVPIAASKGAPAVEPSRESVLDGSYVLGRRLYVYFNAKPGSPTSPLIAEFLRFVLSKNGQEVAAREGNFPLSAALVGTERAKLR